MAFNTLEGNAFWPSPTFFDVATDTMRSSAGTNATKRSPITKLEVLPGLQASSTLKGLSAIDFSSSFFKRIQIIIIIKNKI